MRSGLTKLAFATIAALALGAAIAAPAQKRAARPPAAKPTPSAPVPAAPAKKNERPEADAPAREVTPAQPSPAPEPAKKNAAARPAEGGGSPADTSAARAADGPRYFYEFRQPDFIVPRIEIEHDAAGRGRITFERRNDGTAITDPLEISPAAFARIVGAWEALRFLDSDASYQADKQFPNLGTVRLRMKRGARERAAEFNWTNDDAARTLANEYRNLAEQQIFVFDMGVARQYQPSETVRLLKRVETLLDRKAVSDASQLVPLLSDLSTDERIPLMARNHAGRLLKKIQK
jgi:hypothetical protein